MNYYYVYRVGFLSGYPIPRKNPESRVFRENPGDKNPENKKNSDWGCRKNLIPKPTLLCIGQTRSLIENSNRSS